MGFNRDSQFLRAVPLFLLIVFANVVFFRFIFSDAEYASKSVMGGTLHSDTYDEEDFEKESIQPDTQYIERFLRPSDLKPLEKKYSFGKGESALPSAFLLPSDVVQAYFDVLSDASNMGNKKAGCGSIGYEKAPYPVAYGLLSQNYKKTLPYDRFLKSFEGIGHISLLKLVEAPAAKSGDRVTPVYFVEIETIEGSSMEGKTYFAYYYGKITAILEGENGWKINSVDLNSEDFLCHAYHGWSHDALSVVQLIYGEKCNIVDKVLGVQEDGYFINVYAKGKDGKQYRFMFVRITNGADIELRQYVMVDGKWKDIVIDSSKCLK